MGFPWGDLKLLNVKFFGVPFTWVPTCGEFDLGRLEAANRGGSGGGIKSRFRPTSLISGRRARTSPFPFPVVLPEVLRWDPAPAPAAAVPVVPRGAEDEGSRGKEGERRSGRADRGGEAEAAAGEKRPPEHGERERGRDSGPHPPALASSCF